MCGVRRRNTGTVTQLLRNTTAAIIELGDEKQKAKHKADIIQKAKLQLKKGATHNNNMTEILAKSKEELKGHLTMLNARSCSWNPYSLPETTVRCLEGILLRPNPYPNL